MGKKLDNYEASQADPTFNELERIEIFASKSIKGVLAVFWIAICGITIYGIFIVPLIIIFAIWVVPIFIFMAISSVKDYFDHSPDLIITNDFIEYKKWPFKQVQWENISDVKKQAGASVLGPMTIFFLGTKNPDDFIPYADFVERFFYRFSKRKDLRLNSFTLEINDDDLFRLINDRILKPNRS